MRAKLCGKEAFCDNLIEELGWSVFRNGIQGPAKNIVIELIPGYLRSKEAAYGNVIKEFGEEIEPAFDESQTIDGHGFDYLRMAQVVMPGFGKHPGDYSTDSK
jgi:hypothetical protein